MKPEDDFSLTETELRSELVRLRSSFGDLIEQTLFKLGASNETSAPTEHEQILMEFFDSAKKLVNDE